MKSVRLEPARRPPCDAAGAGGDAALKLLAFARIGADKQTVQHERTLNGPIVGQ